MAVRTTKAESTKNQSSGEKTVNQYRLLSEAGRGAFCKVKWAEDVNKNLFAVKVFSRGVLDRQVVALWAKDGVSTVKLMERITEELRLLEELRHEFVVSLQEVIDDPGHDKLYAVMEGLPGGQLMNWTEDAKSYSVRSASTSETLIQKHWGDSVTSAITEADPDSADVFQESVARWLMEQLINAVGYMHSKGVMHKDLKPDNILLTHPVPVGDRRFVKSLSLKSWPSLNKTSEPSQTGDQNKNILRELFTKAGFAAKIGDFNSASACELPDCLIYDAEGTQLFTPPECFESRDGGVAGKPRDMWSIGVVLFTMFFGKTPHWAEENIHLQLKIMQDELVVPVGLISASAEDLIRSLMNKDPRTRPSTQSAASHVWLTQ